MNIDWKMIKEKYTNALKIYITYLIKNKNLQGNNNFVEVCVFKMLLENKYCYCDLEKFFDDNGIELDEIYMKMKKFLINKNEILSGHVLSNYRNLNIIKLEAKQQAILKAFEILHLIIIKK